MIFLLAGPWLKWIFIDLQPVSQRRFVAMNTPIDLSLPKKSITLKTLAQKPFCPRNDWFFWY